MEEDANIFGEEVNSILREDSVVRRMSPYLTQLIRSSSPVQQQELQGQQQLGQISVNGITGSPSQQPHQRTVGNSNSSHSYHQQHQPQQYNHREDHSNFRLQDHMQQPVNLWDTMASENSNFSYADDERVDNQQQQENLPNPNHHEELQLRIQGQQLPNPSNSWGVLTVPNSDMMEPVPQVPEQPTNIVASLQPWGGRYNFSVSLTTDNKDKNKWCYNAVSKKLYMCPNIAVPVNVSVHPRCDAVIRIIPVFIQSQHRLDPVTRCYNCKSTKSCDAHMVEHIVQVDGEGSLYEDIQERHVVTVPLAPPPPGEDASTLLIKMMCLTSCVGGPNRRPFCLVFTLLCNLTGREIGRQILDIKCCKCPQRDMTNEDKPAPKSENTSKNDAVNQVRKLSSQITVGQKRKRPAVEMDFVPKAEPGTQPGFVSIAVPVQFEREVKRHINRLLAEEIIKRNHPGYLLYPDVEDDK